MKPNKTLEDLFKDGLGNMSVAPPPTMWDKLDTELEKSDVSSLYRKQFKDDKEEPPRGVWFAIQRQLWLQQFLRFNVARINAYYVAGALLAGVGLGYVALHSDGNTMPQTSNQMLVQPKQQTIAIAESKPIVSQSNMSDAKVSSPSIVEPQQKATLPVAKAQTVADTPKEHKENKSTPKPAIASVPFPKSLSITGDKQVCEGTEHAYSLQGSVAGLSNIHWSVSAEDGVVSVLSPTKVMVDWKKSGPSQIFLTANINGQETQTSYSVQVVENKSSKIIGKTLICEGSKSLSYRVDNKEDVNKVYTWKTIRNTNITIAANGFVKIDFTSLGSDTVILQEVNTQTGCLSRVALPVVVNARPVADFAIREKGDGEFEFINTSQCGKAVTDCKLQSKWAVGENQYAAQNIRYQFDVSGVYTISLQVQDQNNCSASIERDVQISVGKMFIPTGYSLSGRINGFSPVAENLSSYKIEIFTEDNRKIWESTALSDGKPTESWDGTIDGQKAILGVYVWRIQASFRDGGEWRGVQQNGQYKKTGSFLLLE